MCVCMYIINSCILTVSTYHTTRPFQMNRSVVFTMFTELCNHYHQFRVSFFFYQLLKKCCTHELSPVLLSPKSLATISLPSFCMNLPILDIKYKQNHSMCLFVTEFFLLSIMFSRLVQVETYISTSFLSVPE